MPNILENPVIVLQSKSSDSRVVIFAEVVDHAGTPVTAVLELQPTNRGGELLDLNVLVSTYGKDNNLDGFLQGSNVLYLDENKKRTTEWLNAVGLQLPSVASNHLGSIGSITYENGRVNIEGVPFSDVVGDAQDAGDVKYSLKGTSSGQQHMTDNAREMDLLQQKYVYWRSQTKRTKG